MSAAGHQQVENDQSDQQVGSEPEVGIEPTTYRLQGDPGHLHNLRLSAFVLLRGCAAVPPMTAKDPDSPRGVARLSRETDTRDAAYDATMAFERISVDHRVMGGVPCIRGTRIPVTTVVGMVAEDMTTDEIIDEFPQLRHEDIQDALRYAAAAVDERELPLRSAG